MPSGFRKIAAILALIGALAAGHGLSGVISEGVFCGIAESPRI